MLSASFAKSMFGSPRPKPVVRDLDAAVAQQRLALEPHDFLVIRAIVLHDDQQRNLMIAPRSTARPVRPSSRRRVESRR